MKKLSLYSKLFFLFFNVVEGNAEEIAPVKHDFLEVFNVGNMFSHVTLRAEPIIRLWAEEITSI